MRWWNRIDVNIVCCLKIFSIHFWHFTNALKCSRWTASMMLKWKNVVSLPGWRSRNSLFLPTLPICSWHETRKLLANKDINFCFQLRSTSSGRGSDKSESLLIWREWLNHISIFPWHSTTESAEMRSGMRFFLVIQACLAAQSIKFRLHTSSYLKLEFLFFAERMRIDTTNTCHVPVTQKSKRISNVFMQRAYII